MARARRIITEGSAYFERQLEKDDGTDLFRDDARFTSEHEVEAGGSAIESRHALLASGAKPGLPAIPGIDTVPVVTSDDLLEATALPEHLVCVGAGAVGLEFAQAHRRLGATVTVVQRGPHIASGEDAELADMLQGYLEEEGIHISTRAACNHLQPDGDCVRVDCVDGESVTADRVLGGFGEIQTGRGRGRLPAPRSVRSLPVHKRAGCGDRGVRRPLASARNVTGSSCF